MAQRRANRDKMNRYSYPTASVQAGNSGRVAIARVRGIVTKEAAGRIIADSGSWCGRLGAPLATVVVYRDATVAIETDDLLMAAGNAYRQGAGLAATALVVSPDQAAMFREYARLSAERGILKRVFLSVEDAQRWAAQQAVVAEAWQKMRLALRSVP